MPRFVPSSRPPIVRSIALAAFAAAASVYPTAAAPSAASAAGAALVARAGAIADGLDDEELVGQVMMIG
ncbi:MAG TPA: hypothetical protein PLH55_03115, partial [Spirochaetales bacterium]|nr:hypothetical protein [Spirochaetales bacterium]